MARELKHVLCIDDEQDILAVAKMCLEVTGGLKVTCCSSAIQALPMLAQINPDLIMLDVMMPQMSGLDALKEIRKNKEFDRIPVVFLTARVQPPDIDAYRSMGATDVIVKPFDPMALVGQIKEIWGRTND